jgi:hypothetical protein
MLTFGDSKVSERAMILVLDVFFNSGSTTDPFSERVLSLDIRCWMTEDVLVDFETSVRDPDISISKLLLKLLDFGASLGFGAGINSPDILRLRRCFGSTAGDLIESAGTTSVPSPLVLFA